MGIDELPDCMCKPAFDRPEWQRTWKEQRILVFAGREGEITLGEYRKEIVHHKAIVQFAIYRGREVPPQVLADYPDLRR